MLPPFPHPKVILNITIPILFKSAPLLSRRFVKQSLFEFLTTGRSQPATRRCAKTNTKLARSDTIKGSRSTERTSKTSKQAIHFRKKMTSSLLLEAQVASLQKAAEDTARAAERERLRALQASESLNAAEERASLQRSARARAAARLSALEGVQVDLEWALREIERNLEAKQQQKQQIRTAEGSSAEVEGKVEVCNCDARRCLFSSIPDLHCEDAELSIIHRLIRDAGELKRQCEMTSEKQNAAGSLNRANAAIGRRAELERAAVRMRNELADLNRTGSAASPQERDAEAKLRKLRAEVAAATQQLRLLQS